MLKILNTRHLLCCFVLAAGIGRAAPARFDEVYQLLHDNLQGVSQDELDRAAVKGLLAELPGQAMLVEAASNAPAAPDVSKAAVYDQSFAYLRVATVEAALPEKLRAAYDDIVKTNKSKIKGVVLDLRFAAGDDYKAAAAAADCFLNSEAALLDWGSGTASATKKTNVIAGPVAILVNSQTSGAAEGLAAALREADTGLILGDSTAGQANIFKDFPLRDGAKLRIATAPIKLGNGTTLSHGVKPDIIIDESLADERAYLEDPYRVLHPVETARNESSTNSAAARTNDSPHRPTNEAELVRERRDGQSGDEDGPVKKEISIVDEAAPPFMADAVLARALDLLKGLAVLQQNHPG
jgi:hypothetical protein